MTCISSHAAGQGFIPISSTACIWTRMSRRRFSVRAVFLTELHAVQCGWRLDYVFQDLGQLTLSVRYEYERYLDGNNLDEFYVNNAVNVLVISSSSSPTRRPSRWAGRVPGRFMRNLRTQRGIPMTLGGLALADHRAAGTPDLLRGHALPYPDDDNRVDLTQNVGGSLNYYFTKWAKISASANFGGNASTESFYNYNRGEPRRTLGLDFRF